MRETRIIILFYIFDEGFVFSQSSVLRNYLFVSIRNVMLHKVRLKSKTVFSLAKKSIICKHNLFLNLLSFFPIFYLSSFQFNYAIIKLYILFIPKIELFYYLHYKVTGDWKSKKRLYERSTHLTQYRLFDSLVITPPLPANTGKMLSPLPPPDIYLF